MHCDELSFLEVGDHVGGIDRNDGHQLGTRRDILPDPQRARADRPIDRRRDRRVAEVQLGLLPAPPGRARRGPRLLPWPSPGRPPCAVRPGPMPDRAATGMPSVRGPPASAGHAARCRSPCRPVRDSARHPPRRKPSEARVAATLATAWAISACCRSICASNLLTAASAAATSARCLRQGRTEITVVDACQHLAGFNRLVVANQHLGKIAGNLWRDRGVVGFHVGVVRADQKAAGRPVSRIRNGRLAAVPASSANASPTRVADLPAA